MKVVRELLVLIGIGLFLLYPFQSTALDFQNRLATELSLTNLEEEKSRSRENHWGDRFFDGANIQTTFLSHLSSDDAISLALAAAHIAPREGRNLFLRQGFVRLVLWNTALKVGRDSLWWGPGRHGALLVSNNAFPFDMIQLGSASPFHLPGGLSRIGSFEVEGFLTRLEGNRDVPHVRLFGLRLVFHPSADVTVGLSRVVMFGGSGRPGLSLSDWGRIYFGDPNESGRFEVNELAGFDLMIWLPVERFFPGHSIGIYTEYGGEDEAGFRPTKPAYLAGLEWGYQNGRFILEYANNHVSGSPNVWYNHHLYTSGYTYRGNIIGHHMGSDADDLFLRFSFPLLETLHGGVDFEKERRHLSSPIQEKILRWGGDLTLSQEADRTYLFRFLYERIKNLDLQSENAKNMYGIITLVWQF